MKDADHCLAKNCQQSGNGDLQSSALVSPTETLNRDVAPIGDDIESPWGISCRCRHGKRRR